MIGKKIIYDGSYYKHIGATVIDKILERDCDINGEKNIAITKYLILDESDGQHILKTIKPTQITKILK